MDKLIVPQKRIRKKKARVGGIYQFRQISTGKKYIGRTRDFYRRQKEHRKELSEGTHFNCHLQRAWNECGPDDFVFEILEIIEDESRLKIREQWHLDNNIIWRFDFNFNKDSNCPPDPAGRECTPETRKKLSEAHSGRTVTWGDKISESKMGKKYGPQSQDHVDKRMKAKVGWKMTDEQRQQLSDAHKGKRHTPEAKAKMSESRKGKRMPPKTPEALANMSRAQMGKKASPEARANMAKAQTGKKHSPESIAKMSLAQKGRIPTPQARANMTKGQLARQERERNDPESWAKMSESRKGRKATPEARSNMSKAQTGRKHTPETIAKMSLAKMGKKHTPETKAKMSLAKKSKRAQGAQ